MPNKIQHYPASLFILLLIILTSCKSSKLALEKNDHKLEIAQHNLPQPYIAQPENASVLPQTENKVALQDKVQTAEKKNNISIAKKQAKNLKATAKRSVQKVRELAPDKRELLQTASKKWKPGKDNFNVNWKDILFVFILLGLLALLGVILHNWVGLSFVVVFVIAMAIAFFVICIYIWYLNND